MRVGWISQIIIGSILMTGCTNQINSDRLEIRQQTSETAEEDSVGGSVEQQDNYEIDTYSLEEQAESVDEIMLGQSLDSMNDAETRLYILDFIPVKTINSSENIETNRFITDLQTVTSESNLEEYVTDTLNINIQDILNCNGTVLVGQTDSLKEYHGTIEISPGLFLKPAYDLNKNIVTYKESNIYDVVDNLGNYYNTDKTILKYIITDGKTYVIARDTALENNTEVYELQAIQTGYKSQATIETGSYISQYSMSNNELETAVLDNSAQYQMIKFIYDDSLDIETDDKTLKNIDDFSISQIDIEASGLTKRVQIGEPYLIKNKSQYKLPMTVQIGVYNSNKQEVHLYESKQSYESTNQVTEYNVYSILRDAIEQESITGKFEGDPEEQAKLAEINQNIASNSEG